MYHPRSSDKFPNYLLPTQTCHRTFGVYDSGPSVGPHPHKIWTLGREDELPPLPSPTYRRT